MKKISVSLLLAASLMFFNACKKDTAVETAKESEITSAKAQSNSLTSKSSDKELELFLTSTRQFNLSAKTITLPLFKGLTASGAETYYIITEASSKERAEQLGVNFSPRLATAKGTKAVQKITYSQGLVRFKGTVNFAPQRSVTPNATTGFPPIGFAPGSIGDADYSPLIELPNGTVLNAAQIANNTGVHDRVVTMDMVNKTATLEIVRGFYEDKEIFYIVTDASADLPAALEASTFASNLNTAPSIGVSSPSSSRAGIILVVNGQRGISNPNRQGLESALMGEGEPLNILQEEPNNSGSSEYSPLWDAHMMVWTSRGISTGQRKLVTDFDDVSGLFRNGFVEAPSIASGPANRLLGGLKATGFVINCPAVAILK